MIVLRRTSRGFLRGDFQDLNGDSCSIQESSSAQAPAIWLGANHGTHHHVTGDCLARMHLSIPLCEALIPLLRHFIEHGELPEGPLRQGGRILRGAEAMTPHEIIAGLLAGIDDAEGSGPVWDAELLAAARDYLASPEDAPAPLPEPDLSEPAGGAAIEGGADAPPSGRHKDQPVVQGLVSLVDVYQAQLARALGEAAGLREALSFVSVKCANTHCQYIDPRYLRPEGEGLIRRALASTPLAERAGEVLEAVVRLQQSESWAEFWNAQSDPGMKEEWLAVGRTVDALRTELGQG